MRNMLVLLVFLVTAAIPATAENREVLHAGEVWSLYSDEGAVLRVGDGEQQTFDSVCVLEAVVSLENFGVAESDGARAQGILSVSVLPSGITNGLPGLRGLVWVEMTGGIFDFPDRVDGTSLSTLNGFYGAPDANYVDSVLEFVADDAERFREFLESGTDDEVIFVRDYRGKTLMRFPTAGLADVRDLFWECAGL